MGGFGKLPGWRSAAQRNSSRRPYPGAASTQPSPARQSSAAAVLITSRDNRWLRQFRMTLRGGLPTDSGCVGVEGVRLVEEALRSGCRMEAVLFSESGERLREHLAPSLAKSEIGIPILRTTDRLFEGIADTEHPQGVAALVQPRPVALENLFDTAPNACSVLLVVLAGVQDPGNVGTILRTAAAFGATGAITAATAHSGTANPYAPKALRASAGATLHLPILAGMSLPILLTQLKVRGVRILASSVHEPHTAETHLDEERTDQNRQQLLLSPWEVDWCQPAALLIGNEGAGLPQEVERSADARIRIPISAGIESLNAAAAAAVLFYEAARQRNALAQRAIQPAQASAQQKQTPASAIEPFRLT